MASFLYAENRGRIVNRAVGLLAAGALMLPAGVIFAAVGQWICAAMLWAGAAGSIAAALCFRNKQSI